MGAVMLIESCDPRDECEWAEASEAEELCTLGRRVCTWDVGMFQFCGEVWS